MSSSGLDSLTTSAAKAYRACPKLYDLSYEQQYRGAAADPNQRFGTLGHRGLEAWWTAWMSGEDPIADAIREVRAFQARSPYADAFDSAKVEALMMGYHARWSPEMQDGRYEVLAVEAEYAGPLVNPETGAASKTWRCAGKIDAILREHATGRVLLVESKTSSEDVSPGSDYWLRLTLDPQVSNYLAAARWLGHDAAAVLYDVISKPALRPRMATPEEDRKYTKKTGELYANQRERDETPSEYFERIVRDIAERPTEYFARGEIVRLEGEKTEAARDLWQIGVQIKDSRRLKLWPRNPDACMRYGRRCSFLDYCTGVASLDDGTRFRRAERAHEELSAQ